MAEAGSAGWQAAAAYCRERTVKRMAPLTRFANKEPEPPGSSANTVYMFIASHFSVKSVFPSACTRAQVLTGRRREQ